MAKSNIALQFVGAKKVLSSSVLLDTFIFMLQVDVYEYEV